MVDATSGGELGIPDRGEGDVASPSGIVVFIDVSNIRVTPPKEDRARRRKTLRGYWRDKFIDEDAQMFQAAEIERVFGAVDSQFKGAVVVPVAGSSYKKPYNWIGDGFERDMARLQSAFAPRWLEMIHLQSGDREENDNIIVGTANQIATDLPDVYPVILTNDKLGKIGNLSLNPRVSHVGWMSTEVGISLARQLWCEGFNNSEELMAAAGVLDEDFVEHLRTTIPLSMDSKKKLTLFGKLPSGRFRTGPRRKAIPKPFGSGSTSRVPHWSGALFGIRKFDRTNIEVLVSTYGVLRVDGDSAYLRLGLTMPLTITSSIPSHLIDRPVRVVGTIVGRGDHEVLVVHEVTRYDAGDSNVSTEVPPSGWSLAPLAKMRSRVRSAAPVDARSVGEPPGGTSQPQNVEDGVEDQAGTIDGDDPSTEISSGPSGPETLIVQPTPESRRQRSESNQGAGPEPPKRERSSMLGILIVSAVMAAAAVAFALLGR